MLGGFLAFGLFPVVATAPVSRGFFVSQGVKMDNKECFIYVNVALFKGFEVSKVGITNNINKRINEFNNEIKHRSCFCHDLCGVVFSNFFKLKLSSRLLAEKIEKEVHLKIKNNLLNDFGREVFFVSPEETTFILKNIVAGVAND